VTFFKKSETHDVYRSINIHFIYISFCSTINYPYFGSATKSLSSGPSIDACTYSVQCTPTAFLCTHTLTLSAVNSPNAATPPIHFPLDLLASGLIYKMNLEKLHTSKNTIYQSYICQAVNQFKSCLLGIIFNNCRATMESFPH